jgi:hypothetical protein
MRAAERVGVSIGNSTIWAQTSAGFDRGRCVAACIRADDVMLHPAVPLSDEDRELVNRYRGRIGAITNLGPLTSVALDCGFPLCSYVMTRQLLRTGFSVGNEALVEIGPGSVHVTHEE